jgi:ubiquinone/menaquinone biosynthesis C-methylase UbiE
MATPEKSKTTKSEYVLGHTDRERHRLSLQASILNPLTDSFLRRAGVSAGMNVLELGCGIGEVSLIVARLVGPHGHLHGIDIDPAALETARSRIHSAGHDHVTFEQVGVMDHAPTVKYDAVIGRHILIHMKDALAGLHKAVSMVPEGGLLAFHESDLSFLRSGYPELPMMSRMSAYIVEFSRRALPKPDIGTQLFYLMQEAGLPPPECRAEIIMDGGPHSPVYEWITETVISLSPRFQAVGMEPLSCTDSATLVRQLREEAMEKRGVVFGPMMVGAFARKRTKSGDL